MKTSSNIRFEHAGTWQTVEAGEDVRWLPREDAALWALATPHEEFAF